MKSSAPIQPAVDRRTGARSCPECGSVDAKAGAVWGRKSCKTNFDASYRWWDILGKGSCRGRES